MPFEDKNHNLIVPERKQASTDPIQASIDELDKEIEKLLVRRAALVEQLQEHQHRENLANEHARKMAQHE